MIEFFPVPFPRAVAEYNEKSWALSRKQYPKAARVRQLLYIFPNNKAEGINRPAKFRRRTLINASSHNLIHMRIRRFFFSAADTTVNIVLYVKEFLHVFALEQTLSLFQQSALSPTNNGLTRPSSAHCAFFLFDSIEKHVNVCDTCFIFRSSFSEMMENYHVAYVSPIMDFIQIDI